MEQILCIYLLQPCASLGLARARGLPGPIVMVGSQKSSDRGSSDASENLIAAIKWAAEGPKPSGECGDSTVVIMHTSSHDGTCSVQPGTGVRKMHSTRRDAFQNVNSQPLAYIDLRKGEPKIIIQESYQEILDSANREICQKPTMFSPEVRINSVYCRTMVARTRYRVSVSNGPQAIVIHGTGLGHLPIDDPRNDAPENTKIWRVLTRCVNRNIPVISDNSMHQWTCGHECLFQRQKTTRYGITGTWHYNFS